MNERVFIAMPFDGSLNAFYDNAIAPAARAAGLVPHRVDREITGLTLIEAIEEGIRGSLFFFGDLTNSNANVFYEVGFARSINKEVLLVSQTPGDTKFDLRPYQIHSYNPLELSVAKKQLRSLFQKKAEEARKHSKITIQCHGTKFDVPQRNEFWNQLLYGAERKFLLLGTTNKSWIDKGNTQPAELAKSVIRILQGGGEVCFCFKGDKKNETAHRNFHEHFVVPAATQAGFDLKGAGESYKYRAHKRIRYGAVVSDHRLVLLPYLNNDRFRDEALVLEISGSEAVQYWNYLADMENVISSARRVTF